MNFYLWRPIRNQTFIVFGMKRNDSILSLTVMPWDDAVSMFGERLCYEALEATRERPLNVLVQESNIVSVFDESKVADESG